MDKFQVPAQIGKIETLADQTLKLTVYTAKELPADEMTKVFGLNKKEGWLFFAEKPFTNSADLEMPEIVMDSKEEKSPSQRLKARMFVLYKEQHGGDAKGFNQWYADELEAFGQKYLDQMPR